MCGKTENRHAENDADCSIYLHIEAPVNEEGRAVTEFSLLIISNGDDEIWYRRAQDRHDYKYDRDIADEWSMIAEKEWAEKYPWGISETEKQVRGSYDSSRHIFFGLTGYSGGPQRYELKDGTAGETMIVYGDSTGEETGPGPATAFREELTVYIRMEPEKYPSLYEDWERWSYINEFGGGAE